MYSLATIRSMSAAATRRAASRDRKPFVPYDAEEALGLKPTDLPFLGDHVPEGWEAVDDAVQVDNYGVDTHGPALSWSSFRAWMQRQPLMGFGVVEAGQFQCYVQAYKPPATRKHRRNAKRRGKSQLPAPPVAVIMQKVG